VHGYSWLKTTFVDTRTPRRRIPRRSKPRTLVMRKISPGSLATFPSLYSLNRYKLEQAFGLIFSHIEVVLKRSGGGSG
jgi:hypothetical protein